MTDGPTKLVASQYIPQPSMPCFSQIECFSLEGDPV